MYSLHTQKNDKEKRQKHLLLWHSEEKLKFQVGVTINKWFLDSPLEILIQLRTKPVLNKTEICLLNIIPQNKLKTTKCKKKNQKTFKVFSENLRVDSQSCQRECSYYLLRISGPYLIKRH